jgi:hypothetical protein
VALSTAVSLSACRKEAKLFAGHALVVLGQSRFVSLVDLAAFALVTKVEFPAVVTQLVRHPQHNAVYALSPEEGQVFEYDFARRGITRRLRLPGPALEMRADPNGPSVWISLTEPKSLVEVSLETLQVTRRAPLPGLPLSMDISPYRTHLAACLEGGGVAIVTERDHDSVRTLRVNERFGLVRFRSDGRQLLAANHSGRCLSVFRGADAQPVVDLPVAMEARHFCFKPDGGQLFVTDGVGDGVAIVYPYTTEVDRAVLAGKSPGSMAACSALPYLLVANRLSSDLTILDMITGRLVAVVPVGNAPGYVAVTPDQQYALVLNEGSGDMAVIRLAAVRSRRNKTAPLFTMVPVGESPQSMVVLAPEA